MQTGLIIAIAAGLIAMIGWGTADFFAKKSVDKVGDLVSLFWMQLLGIVPLILIFLVKRDFSGITWNLLMWVFVLALIDAVGYWLFYKALEKGKVSIIGPIVASYSAFSVIIAAIFLGEKLSPQTGFFLFLIIAGIILAFTDFAELKKSGFKKEDFAKGVPEALMGVALFSVWFPFWDKLVGGQNWLVLVILLRVIMSLMLLVGLKVSKKAIMVRDKTVFRWLIVVGVLDAIAYVALTWGYGVTAYVSIITVLAATFSIPTLILARIFLKEKLQKAQLIGIAIIILGIALLTLL
jgi:drug/metabolite transporter (DMT)-like permease